MKLAAVLALMLAIVLGIWAVSDYVQNQNERRDDLPLLNDAIGHESEFNSEMAEINRIDGQERYDGVIGIVAIFALIGSSVMFSQSGKNNGNNERKRQEIS